MAPSTLTPGHASTKTPTYCIMESKQQTVNSLTWARSSPRRPISFMALWGRKVWAHGKNNRNTCGERCNKTVYYGTIYQGIEMWQGLTVMLIKLTFKAILPLVRAGKVLVHCARGVSRSATLTLAFLMIKEGLTLVEAVEAVRRRRNILPNVGFLNQLCHLDSSLALQRKPTRHQGVEKQSLRR